jgi:hypothetical protein
MARVEKWSEADGYSSMVFVCATKNGKGYLFDKAGSVAV